MKQQASAVELYSTNAIILSNIQSIQREMAGITEVLKDIDQRLGSLSLKIMENIGLDRGDVQDDKHLHILPNDKLSRNDLSRKKALLQDRYAELTEELRSQYAVMRQLKLDIDQEHNRQQTAELKQQQQQIVKQYQTNPQKFFAETTKVLQTGSKPSKEQIFTSAEQLINVCEYFDNQTDLELVWQGWKVVVKARNYAAQALNNFIADQQKDDRIYQNLSRRNDKFYTGAKQYFVAFTNLLPLGLQGLKLLYDARDFDRVEYYLNEAFSQAIMANRQEYLQLLIDLSGEVHEACMRNSTQILTKNPDFSGLAKPKREELIREHAYATQFRFDMSFMLDNLRSSEMEILKQYAQMLEKHINQQLHSKIDADVSKAEFTKIRLQIAQHGEDIRNRLLDDTYDKLPDAICLGSGLGLGWLYGVYNIHASGRAIKLPELANDLSLSSVLEGKDYNFITEEDKFWSKSLNSTNYGSLFGQVKHAVKHGLKKIRGLFAKPELVDSDNYNFTIPKDTLLEMESIAPGFGARLAAHFKRRAADINLAIDQSKKINNLQAIEIITKDLTQLEDDWTRIMCASEDQQKFCALVDLYLTSRYVAERSQYIDLSKDLLEEQQDPQVRQNLFF